MIEHLVGEVDCNPGSCDPAHPCNGRADAEH